MAKIKAYCFSPTGATMLVTSRFMRKLGEILHVDAECLPYTLPHERETMPVFAPDDIVVWATPVYAGRIPNKTLDFVRKALVGNGNPAIALVTFGNRAYDNALAELVSIMQDGGMRPVGAAAVVTRHAFSDTLGAGRPDASDLAALDSFAADAAELIAASNAGESVPAIAVPGVAHPERYYTPLKVGNAPAGFLKAKPTCAAERCSHCGKCLSVCPMGSIAENGGLPAFDGICIKCQACRRICPTGAIAFTDPDYLSHVAMIERTFADPKRSEFFVAKR